MATVRENFLRVIAVLGLIAILLLGAWGIIQIAFSLPSFFSNFGATDRSSKEALSVSLPREVPTGAVFPLSWTHNNKSGAYSYSISYSCAQGLQFAAPLPNGAFELAPCNTPFNYLNATSTTPIVGVLGSGAKQASTTIIVAATRLSDGIVTVKGAGSVTINATSSASVAQKPAATSKPKVAAKPSSTYVSSGRTTNLYGYPDLVVQIISNPDSVPAGSRIALQFAITNVGTNLAPASWDFIAALPYTPIYSYNSGPQRALYPGDKIVYTLGYDAVYPADYPPHGYGGGTGYNNAPGFNYAGGYNWGASCNNFGPCNVPGYANYYAPSNYYTPGYAGYGSAQTTITVDPYNYVQDANRSNNTAAISYTVY